VLPREKLSLGSDSFAYEVAFCQPSILILTDAAIVAAARFCPGSEISVVFSTLGFLAFQLIECGEKKAG
jgi:hypothetical protein